MGGDRRWRWRALGQSFGQRLSIDVAGSERSVYGGEQRCRGHPLGGSLEARSRYQSQQLTNKIDRCHRPRTSMCDQ